ncbi:MAG: FAD-dependent oxidoreductase [Nanoarchaeota archaeon]|nr:FAD-dependent oxidoreductase [Nanoarchaeota archaeon]
MKTYDLIIIGTGPAGLAAALYAARYNMDIIVIGKLSGGTAATAHKVCNYPGFEEITGPDLMMKMINQVKKLDVEVKSEEVIDIKKDDLFTLKTNKAEYRGKKILIATGSQRAKLGTEREEEFEGKGLSYCATCDASFYKGKTVGVVGGGNSALTAALLLSKFAKKVYIFYRQEKFFRAENEWVSEIERNDKIEPVFSSTVEKLIGKDKLEEIEINKSGKKEKIKIDGIFVEIGGISNIKLAKILGIKLDGNFIVVDKEQKTNIDGVFAAGDVTNNPLKQIVTACGEGAIAGFVAYKEMIKEKRK